MKKKLIAIVTSLAMVATMVPATAFAATAAPTDTSKSAVQPKSTSLFELYMGDLTSSAITKDNAEDKLVTYKNAENAYKTSVTVEEAATPAIQELYAQLETAKNDLVTAFAAKMVDEIAAIAQKGKVGPGEAFTKIVNIETSLTDDLQQSINTVRSKVSNYNDYSEAKKARDLADVIQTKNTDLASTTFAQVEDAVKAIEASTAFKAVTSQATREMASNYKDYIDAKEKVEKVTTDTALIDGYVEKFTAQEEILTGAPSKSTIRSAESLLEQANADKKLVKALENVLVDSGKTTAYTTALGELETAIDTAITAVMDKETAAEFTNKVRALPSTIELKHAGAVQEVFAMMAVNTGSVVAADGTNVTTDDWYASADSKYVADATKTAAFTAIGVAAAGDETGLQKVIAGYKERYTTANALSDAAEKAAALAEIKKEFTDAMVKAFPIPANPTLADEDAVANAKVIFTDKKLVGTDITDYLDADTARDKSVAAAIAKIDELNTSAKAAADAFAKNVLETLPTKKAAANYGTLLDEAKAQYEALSDVYKKYGAAYNDATEYKYTATDSKEYTMANAYDKDSATAGAAVSLMTLIAEYEAKQENAPQDAIITQLVDGVNKLPATDKLTLENQDAVYALRDLREQLNEEKLDEFEALTNTAGIKYNDTLDKAIETIDKLYVADLVNQISSLTIVKKDASLEDITAAKEANKAPREAYDKLNATQKAQVTNYGRLQDAEAAVNAAEMYYATTQMAEVLKDLDLENLTSEQADAILAVDKYIRSLTPAQRLEVEKDANYADFQKAVEAAAELNGGALEDVIDLNKATITLTGVDDATYTGAAIEAEKVEVKDAEGNVVDEKAYGVDYKNNTNAGTATVRVYSANGNTTGSITATFEIKPADIKTTATAGKIANQTYNKKAKTPAITVTAGEKKLVNGSDYTVKYANNTNIGQAKATITGTGNYTGTITKTFIVKPAKEAISSLKAGKKSLTVAYKAQTGAKYRIVYSPAKGQAKAVQTTAAKKTIKSLKSGKTYKVKVRAYKTIDGKKYNGAYSTVKKVKVK